MIRIMWAIRFFVLTMILGVAPGLITLPSLLTTTTTVFAAGKAEPLDLNTANAGQLKALTGVGNAHSAKIIKGRLYTRKDELAQKNILPQATYDKIKDQIVMKQK
ncbi:MAG: helix-hairpin-helix domain-containing protein [Nitrospiraceae bacterium]